MAGTIEFTDGDGTALLSNGMTIVAGGVGARFRGWVPFTRPIGPMETALGTGRSYRFAFRTDYGASFAMDEIPNTSLDIALRLMAHLLNGGLCEVSTGDLATRVYPYCAIAPGTEPELVLQDPTTLHYSLSLSLINVDPTPGPMLCIYGA